MLCKERRVVIPVPDVCIQHGPEPGRISKNVVKEEKDLRVRDLIVTNEFALRAAHERYEAASVSEATAWWYIFWVCDIHFPPGSALLINLALRRMTFGDAIPALLQQ